MGESQCDGLLEVLVNNGTDAEEIKAPQGATELAEVEQGIIAMGLEQQGTETEKGEELFKELRTLGGDRCVHTNFLLPGLVDVQVCRLDVAHGASSRFISKEDYYTPEDGWDIAGLISDLLICRKKA